MAGTTAGIYSGSSGPIGPDTAAPELVLCVEASARGWSREDLRLHLLVACPTLTAEEVDGIVRAWQGQQHGADHRPAGA